MSANSNKDILEEIEEVAKELEERQGKLNFTRYNNIIKDTLDFFKGARVIMYGGAAIDQLLPDGQRIYGEHALADIDVFTTKPRELANQLVRYLEDRGYRYCSIGNALHENTFKVYCNGVQAADITKLDAALYRAWRKRAKKGRLGVYSAPVRFLENQLHLLLASMSAFTRWSKTFDRIKKFYRAFATKPKAIESVLLPADVATGATGATGATDADGFDAAQKEMRTFTKKMKFVNMGMSEIAAIMADETIADRALIGVPNIICLVKDLSLAVESWKSASSASSASSATFAYSPVMHAGIEPLNVVMISCNTRPLALFIQPELCLSNFTQNKVQVATIHTIAYVLLSIIITPYTYFDDMRPTLEVLSDNIVNQQMKGLTGRKRMSSKQNQLLKPVGRNLECIGNYEGLHTLMRNRVSRMAKQKKSQKI